MTTVQKERMARRKLSLLQLAQETGLKDAKKAAKTREAQAKKKAA